MIPIFERKINDIMLFTLIVHTIPAMRIVQLLILTFLLSACRTENDKMLGHWHSIPFEDGYFWTLDITDSTTQTNRYHHSRYQQEFDRIFNYKCEEILWIDYDEYRNIEIKNDTLLLNEHLKFIRVKETHHLHDHFPNSLVHLNLPRSTKSSETELPYRKSQLSHIYIGPPKETEMHSELINLDSPHWRGSYFRDQLTNLENLRDPTGAEVTSVTN
jgi:hypothetical protein